MGVYRESTDVFLHLKHISQLYHKKPKVVTMESVKDKLLLNNDPWSALNYDENGGGDWKPLITVADYEKDKVIKTLGLKCYLAAI